MVNITADSRKIVDSVMQVFHRHQQEHHERSWFIGISFSRPFERTLAKTQLKEIISSFRKKEAKGSYSVRAGGRLTIDFIRANNVQAQEFMLGLMMDQDSGGWVVQKLIDEVPRIIQRKRLIAQGCKVPFDHHKLVLINTLTYNLNEEDIPFVQQIIDEDSFWQSVTFVNPLNPTRSWTFQRGGTRQSMQSVPPKGA